MTDLAHLSATSSVAEVAATYRAAVRTAARAERTSTAYESDWRQWTGFLHQLGNPPLTDTDTVLVVLGAFLDARRSCSAATLRRNLAGIRRGMLDAGLPWPDSPGDRQALADHLLTVARDHAAGLRQAPPIGEGLLRQASAAAPATPKGRRDRAILVVGFLAALRRDSICRLDLADVRFDPEGAALHLRRSKTDQAGVGKRVFVPLTRHPGTCATRTLQAWLADRGGDPGPLFWSVRSHRRLDGSAVYRVVRELTAATGDPTRYTAHSLRAGLITAAAKRGASPHAIKQQSGHASIEMVERYTRTARGYADNVVHLLEGL